MIIEYKYQKKINIKRLMRNVTKILSDEHQNIVKVTDIVLNECDQHTSSKPGLALIN